MMEERKDQQWRSHEPSPERREKKKKRLPSEGFRPINLCGYFDILGGRGRDDEGIFFFFLPQLASFLLCKTIYLSIVPIDPRRRRRRGGGTVKEWDGTEGMGW